MITPRIILQSCLSFKTNLPSCWFISVAYCITTTCITAQWTSAVINDVSPHNGKCKGPEGVVGIVLQSICCCHSATALCSEGKMSGISEPWGFVCWRSTRVWLVLFTPHDVERKKLCLSGVPSLHHLRRSGEMEPGGVKKKLKSAEILTQRSSESLKELFCHDKTVVMPWWYTVHPLNYLNESAHFSITTRPFVATAIKKNEWLKRLSSYLCTFLRKEF